MLPKSIIQGFPKTLKTITDKFSTPDANLSYTS